MFYHIKFSTITTICTGTYISNIDLERVIMTLCAQAQSSFCFTIYLRLVNVPVMFSCLQIKRQRTIDNVASRVTFKKMT